MGRTSSQDYVKYASYAYISRYEETESSKPTGVLFNKFMTLLNVHLKDTLGENIKLPHCWYRWGDEVVRYNMPYVVWNQDDPRKTTVSFSGAVPDMRRDRVTSTIDDYVGKFIRRYSGPEGAEMAIDEVYSNAPFEFQNGYRLLRENLKISKNSFNYTGRIDLVRGLYEDAMRTYPAKSFPKLEPQRIQFEKVFSKALDECLSPDRLEQISETFWFFFCYHLRLHSRCHENVPKETLTVWKSALPDALDEYEEKMQNYAHYLFREGSDDDVIRDMLKERDSRLARIDELMAALE